MSARKSRESVVGGVVCSKLIRGLCYVLLKDGVAPTATTSRAYLLLVCYEDSIFNSSNIPFCARQVAEALGVSERSAQRSLESLYDAGLVERAPIRGRFFYRVGP